MTNPRSIRHSSFVPRHSVESGGANADAPGGRAEGAETGGAARETAAHPLAVRGGAGGGVGVRELRAAADLAGAGRLLPRTRTAGRGVLRVRGGAADAGAVGAPGRRLRAAAAV